MELNIAQKNLEQSLTGFAKKIAPAVEAILKTLKPEDLADPAKVAAVAIHSARTIFNAINLNVNAKVVIPSLSIIIGKPDDKESRLAISSALPMIVTSNPPMFGDFVMMDQRIPQEFQPTLVSRVHYPFNGGHMMIGLSVWVENEEKAAQCFALYEKFLGAQKIEVEPEKTDGQAQPEGQSAVPPSGN